MSVTAVHGQWEDFHHRALERVSALPGVEQAAFAWGVPLTGNNWPGFLEIEGQPAPAKESDRIAIPLRSATEGYFQLLRVPLIEGRDIRSSDDRKAPAVAVVNKAFADRYFPGSSAVGKKFWTGGRSRPGNRNHRCRGKRPDCRPDTKCRAGDLPVSLAGVGVFQAFAGPHGGGSADGDG